MPSVFSLGRKRHAPAATPPEYYPDDTSELDAQPPAGYHLGDAGDIYPADYQDDPDDGYPLDEEGDGEEGDDEAYLPDGGFSPQGGVDAAELDEDESWLAPDTRRRVRIAIPTFLLGTLIVIAGAFWGGAVVDKHFGDHSTTTTAASAFSRLGGGTGATGAAGGAGGFGGISAAGGFGGFTRETPVAEGTLSAVSGDDLMVTPTTGAKVKVVMTASTVVTRSGKGTSGVLTVGDTVRVEGTKASDGTVTATSITATAAGVATATGFGGTGGTATGAGATGTGTGGSAVVSGGGFSGDGTGASGG